MAKMIATPHTVETSYHLDRGTVDAKGRVLAPGFIDVHTHVEGAIERLPEAANFVTDGVTTIVTGNCGGSESDVAAFFTRLEKARLG